MAMETVTTQANEAPQDAWLRWQREHADVMARATGTQRILLEAAVRFVAAIAYSGRLGHPFRSTRAPLPVAWARSERSDGSLDLLGPTSRGAGTLG
jgi:hypothetical protein